MRIVFGWYSFPIKSYTIEELGLENESNNDIKFQIRQKCFHAFWIPCFGLGKEYAVKKDGIVFEMPYQFITRVDSKGKAKTPWYTFSMPIIGLLVLLGIYVNSLLESYSSYRYNVRSHKEYIANIDNAFLNLTDKHYIQLKATGPSYKTTFLKVLQVKNNDITCIKKNDISESVHPYILKSSFQDTLSSNDTLVVSFAELKTAVLREYDDYSNKYDQGVDLLKNDDRYYIEKIRFVEDGPQPKIASFFSYSTNFHFKLGNDGDLLQLIEIRNLEGHAKWENTLPLEINYRGENIRGKNYLYNKDHKAEFIFVDSFNNQYKYIWTSRNDKSKFEPEIKI